MKLKLLAILYCQVFFVLGQENQEKVVNFFKYADVNIGTCINKASIDYSYGFNTNARAAYLVTLNVINIKNFSFNVSGGYRTKSLIGLGSKNPMPRLKKNYMKYRSANYLSNDSALNINFNYINIDAVFKITFLKKKLLNPYILVGPRVNVFVNYEYKNDVRDSKTLSSVQNKVLPTLKKQYFICCMVREFLILYILN